MLNVILIFYNGHLQLITNIKLVQMYLSKKNESHMKIKKKKINHNNYVHYSIVTYFYFKIFLKILTFSKVNSIFINRVKNVTKSDCTFLEDYSTLIYGLLM